MEGYTNVEIAQQLGITRSQNPADHGAGARLAEKEGMNPEGT